MKVGESGRSLLFCQLIFLHNWATSPYDPQLGFLQWGDTCQYMHISSDEIKFHYHYQNMISNVKEMFWIEGAQLAKSDSHDGEPLLSSSKHKDGCLGKKHNCGLH